MEAPATAATGQEKTFASLCTRCGAQLRIIDNLPAALDVTQSFRGSLGESFVVIPASDPEEYLEQKAAGGQSPCQSRIVTLDEISRVEQVMALAAGQMEQEQPVCADCLCHVVAEVQRQVDQAAEEQRACEEALSRLRRELGDDLDGDLEAETRLLEQEVAGLDAEAQELLRELGVQQKQEAELAQALEEQRRSREVLRHEEDAFWRALSQQQLDFNESEEERAATNSAIRYATGELNRLKCTNVLNEMFHISQEGSFGTINKFRIGRLPEQNVPWVEINAAWGQACLLLDALVKKCGVPMSSSSSTPLSQYRLLPRGSYSAIQAGGDVLELHSNDGGLTRFFMDRRYDLATAAFLGCLKEVTRFFLQREPSMRLPFKIDGDKVGGFSVRVQFNQDERWTKALKFMLSDLKWIIAFVESRDFGLDSTSPPKGKEAASSLWGGRSTVLSGSAAAT